MKNFLFITIDAFGADKCWNLENAQMEFLNAFAKNGIHFTNFFASTSSTTPSLASFHTGLYPKEHGIVSTYGHKLFDNVSTLAESFKENGYKTFASIGGPLRLSTKMNRGFDKFWFHAPEFRISFFRWGILSKRIKYNNYLMKKERKEVFSAPEPWFYWIHILDVHNRWRVKSKIQDDSLSEYEKAVLDLDLKLKGLFDEVDLDNTTVVISADHGHYVCELDNKIPNIDYPEAHGFGTNDVLTNIPLIILDKDIKKNGPCDKIISSVDFLPTILDFKGFKNTYKGHGKSFASLFKTSKEDFIEKPIFLAANGAILRRQGSPFLYALRHNNWKIVVGQDQTRYEPKLYNLETDPYELNNLYDITTQKSIQMQKEIKLMILEVQDGV